MLVVAITAANAVFLVALVAIWLGGAWLAGSIARRKGGDFGIYLVAALILGPLLGLVLALMAGIFRAKRPPDRA